MPYKLDDKLTKVSGNPLFREYGRLILPIHLNLSERLKIKDLSKALPQFNYIQPKEIISVFNFFEKEAKRKSPLFHSIYSVEEKMRDPAKFNTGLFFFKGKPEGPTAILSAGGGFSYVGAIHDSFPTALKLSKQGINAFALIYRPDARSGTEDLARSIDYLFENKQTLEISMDSYSLWGGSAGAQLSNWVGSNGTAVYIGKDYPRPSVIISNYTGMKEATRNTSPTFSIVGTEDEFVDVKNVQTRMNKLLFMGIEHELEVIEGLKHGFGLGTESAAEGWVDRAVDFWKKN